MLNTTFLSLTLHGIASASPYLAQKQSVNLINARLFNSYATFSYNVQHLYVRGSTFNNFLDSAIALVNKDQLYNKLYESRPEQPGIDSEIVIEDAFFVKCVSRSDGGAINYFSPNSGTLSVKRTTFVQCHSGPNPADGGCIAFTGVRSTIFSTCASQCSAGRNGHSFSVTISAGKPDFNHLNQTTILECSPKESARGWQSLFLSYGQIRISDMNSSKNSVATQAGSFMMHTVDSDAVCLHSTIVGNIGPWIIYLYGKEGSLLEQCNVVGNICANKEQNGIVMFHKLGRIDGCLFANNRGRLFKQNRESASIDVSNCVFDAVFDREPGVSTTNCRFEEPDVQTYVLAHLNTELCAAKRDVAKHPIGTNEIFNRLKLYFHEQAQSLLKWIK
ncbi:hypothetical protein TRFO_12502 [Tritrichomonas foetus]|uniref:Right handed beta helix domain-containing protein n=1 Tax=Tritrichomonas foetus TaxID=1144522 RepID=A0A1J4L5V9_9EUKA|nr:hypothetical protein TRFO_12502 [Tritrichomonas foetus]|eukprot:OHT17334.1 hypothetical protein TRFO_12502 [Tritrichomonas foetus]